MKKRSLTCLVAIAAALGVGPAVHCQTRTTQLPICGRLNEAAEQPAAQSTQPKLAPISLPQPKHKSIQTQAKNIGLGPRSLIATPDELDEQRRLSLDSRRKQLTELWNATIEHSEAIQFVVARLQPNSDPQHNASEAMKSLGRLLFGGAQNAAMYLPGSGFAKAGAGLGAGVLSSVLGGAADKKAKSAQTSEETATFLYFEVQRLADNLATAYRSYRINLDRYESQFDHFESLKAMILQIQDKVDSADMVRLHYELICARNDAENALHELDLCEEQLADFAGTEAVSRMKTEIAEEKSSLLRLCGGKRFLPGPITPPQVESADNRSIAH